MEGCPSFLGLAVGYGTSANFPVAHYKYGCCGCGPYHWHLGGDRCSWGWGGRYRMGEYPHLVPSFGKHGSSSHHLSWVQGFF